MPDCGSTVFEKARNIRYRWCEEDYEYNYGVRINRNWDVERAAVNTAHAFFDSQKFIFHEIDGSKDYGKDANVDVVEGGKVTGLCFALQVKGGDRYKRKNGYVIPIEGHAEVWANSSVTVIGIVYDLHDEQMRWCNISEYLATVGNHLSTNVPVSADQILNANTTQELVHSIKRTESKPPESVPKYGWQLHAPHWTTLLLYLSTILSALVGGVIAVGTMTALEGSEPYPSIPLVSASVLGLVVAGLVVRWRLSLYALEVEELRKAAIVTVATILCAGLVTGTVIHLGSVLGRILSERGFPAFLTLILALAVLSGFRWSVNVLEERGFDADTTRNLHLVVCLLMVPFVATMNLATAAAEPELLAGLYKPILVEPFKPVALPILDLHRSLNAWMLQIMKVAVGWGIGSTVTLCVLMLANKDLLKEPRVP